ncbi:hypothetical protein [Methylobacterium oxalidis]|uniref:Uncharacterized protein n=1 Tax=Methylobacterium oxalidis TaxID=944322 RepID=A0A512J4Q0_9HYPH|nr:hypothetical protein [Methylobacterium oxalidis]GEP04934.1 hypothetical protein MOX02_29720 [Methylobacterium oxalidis]GJE35158.1 hypothetical protein LDDCCGHA_5376 [Methylobacterium oxalidis]GLS63671.1 hypothetical protein GCM10007888_20520 [Methylobacterium oxalidis]
MTDSAWDEGHPLFHLTTEEFFGRDPRADRGYWSRAACWTNEEAIALSFGCEPRVVNWEFLKNSGHPFAKLYAERRSLAIRARHVNLLNDFNEPEAFIKWAKRQGISFDPDLEKAVKDGKKVAKTTKDREDEHLNAKSRQSFLKIVLGLAAATYSYDPQKPRGSIVREIKDDLDRIGISLDEDTVRKWLAEAADEFGHLITIGGSAS